MIRTVLLGLTAALPALADPPAAPKADETPARPPAAAVQESARRARAAAVLQEAEISATAPAARVGERARGVLRAALELPAQSTIRRELIDAAEEALDHAESRPAAAELLLDLTVDGALADLAFEPVMEAPLPVGFPWPVPAGEIRVQDYPAYRLARSEMRGGQNSAFFTLFRHIQKNDIAMTAPVEMTMDDRSMVDMAFLYRRPDQGEAGEDGRVLVENVESMQVVSIGVRSTTRSAAIETALLELEGWLADHAEDWERAGPARVLGYNGPQVPRSRQFVEVQIPVQPREAESAGARTAAER